MTTHSDPVYLAIDLGATSGRVIAGIHTVENTIKLREIHRFPTHFAHLPSGYHWDVLGLFNSILEGLGKAAKIFGDRIQSLAVDTWGVDYALLDKNGRLLGNPYQYRDPRTEGMIEKINSRISSEKVYEETGIQFMFFNTINQLVAELETDAGRLELADSLLFLPDLFIYWLCGEQIQERSIASTSQLWNPRTQAWSDALLDGLNLPAQLFKPVTEPGQQVGTIRQYVQDECGLGPVPVIAVAGHDTGSAVAGAPLSVDSPAFLSSGTWSIIGMELPHPVINKTTFDLGFANEAGVEGTTRLLKNISGMWMVVQLKEEWAKEGNDYTYDNLDDMAAEAEPFLSVIDPDDARFASHGPMAQRIIDYCSETGQRTPRTKGEIVRIVSDSLAAKYAIMFEKLGILYGGELPSLRIIGGGCQNSFLNQCTADAIGKPVIAGPVEATSLGNLILQMKAMDVIPDVAAGRQIIENSFESKTFQPQDSDVWRAPIDTLRKLL